MPIVIDTPDDTLTSNLAVCYEVLLYLAGRMARLQPGETLAFVSGDPEAAESIPPWCEMRGFTLLAIEPLADGKQRFLIRR